MALSDVKIRNAKAKAAGYRLTDSHGLSVEITPAGNKLWRYRYRLDGKENLFAAGAWCVAPAGEAAADADARRADGRLTLAEARQARVTWRGQVKAGQHPRLVRATARLLASHAVQRLDVPRRGRRVRREARRRLGRWTSQTL
jgi:hypothetical protein